MKDINLRADAPSQVTQVNPDQLSNEIKTLQEIQQEISNAEGQLKELKEREKYFFYYCNSRFDEST